MRRLASAFVCVVLVLAAAAGGLALRLGWLDKRLALTKPAWNAFARGELPRVILSRRPMHTDEAVQAAKFGDLLDHGRYEYNPTEYHGPTLYYLTLPSAWLQGQDRYVDTTEQTYRLVTAAFGVALVVLLLLAMDGLSAPAVVGAAILTAVSHAMVFYSRYYIQEMLLVFFTFAAIACGWRYARGRRAVWAILTGVCLGLVHATKETAVIVFAALGVALAVTLAWRWAEGADLLGRPPKRRVRAWHLGALLLAGAIVSAVFYTSFFTHWRGPYDSIRAYASYFQKAGAKGVHDRPWHYYLHMLLLWKDEPLRWCPVWSEGLIVVLAIVGVIAAALGRGLGRGNVWFARFLAVYTVVLTAAYSAIPYKTPWCMLGFLHGMILLAALGAAALLRMLPLREMSRGPGGTCNVLTGLVGQLTLILVLAGAGYQLARQAHRGCFRYDVDPRNPYVYAQSLRDVVRLADYIEELARVHPKKRKMQIQVIAPRYWPLPWYLRRFPNVGYYHSPPPVVGAAVVVMGHPNEDDPRTYYGVEDRLSRTYQMQYFGLRARPSVFLRLYVHNKLWEAFLAERARVGQPSRAKGG